MIITKWVEEGKKIIEREIILGYSYIGYKLAHWL